MSTASLFLLLLLTGAAIAWDGDGEATDETHVAKDACDPTSLDCLQASAQAETYSSTSEDLGQGQGVLGTRRRRRSQRRRSKLKRHLRKAKEATKKARAAAAEATKKNHAAIKA